MGFSIFLFERWQGKRFAQLVLLVLTASFHVGLAQGFVEVVLSRFPAGLLQFYKFERWEQGRRFVELAR